MPNRPDISGQRFGRLTVIKFAEMRGAKRAWLCECDCGRSTIAPTSDLRYGCVASCGCLLAGDTAANRKHGHSSRMNGTTPTYRAWAAMLSRCYNPNVKHYENYGGRGITVCERWNTFENFLADMGERPAAKLSLDRINNNGNYEPGNCRWATAYEQIHNRRPLKRRRRDGSEWLDGRRE